MTRVPGVQTSELCAHDGSHSRCYVRRVDPETHKRFLEYRARHEYFGAVTVPLSRPEFLEADAEQLALESKGERRDDDEEARYEELSKLLFRD